MAITHTLEYSKSSRAKCHGPVPCKGSSIAMGALRYGQTIRGEYGETVEWRHWGCVTPAILGQLAALQAQNIAGFQILKWEDQAKVRRAVNSRAIDASDVPEAAKPTLNGSSLPEPSKKKRKATQEAGSSVSLVQAHGVHWKTTARDAIFAEVKDDEELQEEEIKDELYCSMNSSVVGIQYYKGLVGPGEQVRLVREPRNQYDRNAIQVKNIGNAQVGHLPRQVVSKLASLMDQNLVIVEGVIHDGNLSGFSYSLSLTLKIYGASDKRDLLEPLLIWATPRQRGFPPRNSHNQPGHSAASSSAGASTSNRQPAGKTPAQIRTHQEAIKKQQDALRKAAELKSMLNNLEKVDDEGRRNSLLDELCTTDDVFNLPLHPNPPGIESGDLFVDLLKHQSQALQWCIEHEYPVLPKKETDKPVQFWQWKKNGSKAFYFNLATKTPQEAPPVLGRGALCADSMGLGKTLTMIALIIATKKDKPSDFSTCTLVVVPLSILSNWETQIEEHCQPGALSYCIYYGAKREITPTELQKYDIVITTYQTVAAEHSEGNNAKGSGQVQKKKKIQRFLFEVQWKRVILDEGHTIRNSKTKAAKAICALSAQRRWVLSGTPIINSPRDLGSILTFLQICRPLDNEDFFKRLLLRPLKDGDPQGHELLRSLMSQISIRRTKEMQDSQGKHLVPLPPVEMTVVPVTLNEEARALYDAVEEISKERFENSLRDGVQSVVSTQSNVLSMLTRLRQLALHPGLIPKNYLEELKASDGGGEAAAKTVISPEDKARLQSLLLQAIEDVEECPICFGILDEPRITPCAHPFCLACITEVISRDPKCPMDRRQISINDLIDPPPPTELTQVPIGRAEVNPICVGSSAKIDQLLQMLNLTPANEKSLVFSQFTSFLDKIAEALEEQGIPFLRFDGQMSAKRRQETLARFSIPITEKSPPTERTLSSSRRARTSGQTALGQGDAEDSDGDFIMNQEDEDDDDFIADDQETAFLQKRTGKAKGKDKATGKRSFPSDFHSRSGPNPKVMLISLKAGALGLNLTVANNVYLMDPWWQEGIESQAIDRCNRIGQKRPVHVYQLIADNTVESKVIAIQERKKLLVQQAFSAMKRKETPLQKKEARLQDLIELFGVRQRQANLNCNG